MLYAKLTGGGKEGETCGMLISLASISCLPFLLLLWEHTSFGSAPTNPQTVPKEHRSINISCIAKKKTSQGAKKMIITLEIG